MLFTYEEIHMPTLKVGFNKTTNVATVLDASGSIPGGSVEVGTFVHPDATYPDSLVIFHGVRDLLYKRSAKDPSEEGFWPNNIVDMQSISIDMQATPRLTIATKLPRVVSAIEGEVINWHVDVAGGKAPFTYKWQFKADTTGAVFTDIDSGDNASAATATLTLNNVTAASAGTYKVIVTDANGTTVEDESLLAVGYYEASSLVATPDSLALSVAADTAAGKTVTITNMPVGSSAGTLSIKTAPDSARATATIAGNVLTVKPVAAGEATSVVVTNGKVDVTIAITVAE
ncbi:neck whiskers protein [Escherichia phage PGN829.1]|uniref:Neck whiskers protein n=2 Tax=root TaxID=1 RepID=A0A385II53_9CAUD|nr:Hoc-like head decoration [Escherichia phage PGN829.1]AXY82555.1 neck whiskers protein [Escherichia phage PGN829.1]